MPTRLEGRSCGLCSASCSARSGVWAPRPWPSAATPNDESSRRTCRPAWPEIVNKARCGYSLLAEFLEPTGPSSAGHLHAVLLRGPTALPEATRRGRPEAAGRLPPSARPLRMPRAGSSSPRTHSPTLIHSLTLTLTLTHSLSLTNSLTLNHTHLRTYSRKAALVVVAAREARTPRGRGGGCARLPARTHHSLTSHTHARYARIVLVIHGGGAAPPPRKPLRKRESHLLCARTPGKRSCKTKCPMHAERGTRNATRVKGEDHACR